MNSNKKILGRGLSDLFGGNIINNINNNSNEKNDLRYNAGNLISANNIVELEVEKISPCATQPRTIFEEDPLNELAESIKENGVLQPIIVRQNGEKYEIIAGERRWRASKIACKDTIPAIIKNIDDHKAFLISIVENLQRSDLSPLEEAEVYQRLVNDGYTHDQIAMMLNKSRSYISNMVRLTNLTPEVKKLVSNKLLSVGHVKILLSNNINNDLQNKLAQKIVDDELNIRQTEELLKSELGKESNQDILENEVDDNIEDYDLENDDLRSQKNKINYNLNEIAELLQTGLGTNVSIKNKQIIIGYKNMIDLDRILSVILK